jgi:DNA invertase Pin-like site-specific DNA recombinase
MPAIAIYARASRDQEDKRISVERQIERCRRLADELYPGQTVRTYSDNNISGADPDAERPQFEEMVAAIRRGEIAHVVTHEQSRLTRRPGQWDELVVTLTRAGIDKIHTVQQGPVTVGNGSRLVGRIMAAVDAEEVERTKARMLAAHEQNRQEGRPNGGRYYGYERQRGPDGRAVLVIDKAEAKVVQRIATRLLAGYSLSAVADELNTDSVPTPRGGQLWRTTTVRETVTRASVAGLIDHDGKIVGKARWEPIIELERWERLMHVLKSEYVKDARGRRFLVSRRQRSPRKWLLTSGLARCALCGAALVVGQQGRKGPGRSYSAYTCHRTANQPEACGRINISRAEDVEEVVVDAVLDFIDRRPDLAAKLAAAPNPERAALVTELAELEVVISKVSEELGAGGTDYAAWESFYRPAKARMDEVRARLAQLEDPDGIDVPAPDVVRAKWRVLNLRQKRKVLDRYLTEVRVLPRVASGPRPGTARDRVGERLELRWRR